MSAARNTRRTPRPAVSAVPAGVPLTEDDLQRFGAGRHDTAWRCFGAHRGEVDGAAGYGFAVWAPGAASVAVVGQWNRWDPDAAPLERLGSTGVWAGFVAGVEPGAIYKFHVRSGVSEYEINKADPFAFRAQTPSATASVAWHLDFEWSDADWMAGRGERQGPDRPMSIYEMHLGSWRRDPARPDDMPTYDRIGDELIPHLVEHGFTHVELLPVMEHPFYGSWGYQITGFFAASSRYGTPQDLMRLIDRLHGAGIGVILDWVPSHFPGDAHGLGYFDGTRLYEYPDPRVGYQPDWKSYVFNFGRNEVRSFLISNARFWLDAFHADGLRVDAVASMLYLDYSRDEGQWIANKYGGRENLEAISFLRQLNETIHEHCPGAVTIAEESTAWPMVSRPTWVGGLGFDMKWDMGWMHDTLEYIKQDPVHRRFHHDKLTFRMLYAFSEAFVLPLSHDEVVHGKASLVAKMPGDEWRRFASLRALYGMMWAQPGKKLLFMGGEFGPWREWNHDRGLEWDVTVHRPHAGLMRWVADLNRLYRDDPALHERDFHPSGFEWVDCRDAEKSVASLLRMAGDAARSPLLAVFNFTPVPRHHYRVGVPFGGTWHEVLNSDAETYWGSGAGNLGAVEAVPMATHGRPYSLDLVLPPLSAMFFRGEPEQPLPAELRGANAGVDADPAAADGDGGAANATPPWPAGDPETTGS